MTEAAQRREVERWVAWVRLGGLVFAVLEVGLFTQRFPPGYLDAAWAQLGPRACVGVFHSMSARSAMKHAIEIGFPWRALEDALDRTGTKVEEIFPAEIEPRIRPFQLQHDIAHNALACDVERAA